jgi:FdhE protein
MGYVALEPVGGDARLEAAESRWRSILVRRPDLQPAVELQRRLIALVAQLGDAVRQGRLPRLSLPPKYLAAKLAKGIPALAGEPLPIPVAVLKPTLLQLCRELEAGGAGEAARRIRLAIEEKRLDAGSLLTASLARDQQAIRTGCIERGLAPDLVWLVAELAVSPFAHALQQLLLGPARHDLALADALEVWPHGYCPACGSWPALAESAGGRRILRCSFCALAWELKAYACIYCGEDGEKFVTVAPDEARKDRRLELCAACGAYLKTVGVASLSPFPLLAIADLETMDLDMAAMEQGYTRPGLKQIRRAVG